MLTENEKKRLEELTAKRKQTKLDDAEFKEFQTLTKKAKGKGNHRKPGKGDGNGFKPGNDFSWWSKIPELLINSATFKSNYIAGSVIDPNLVNYRVPGVMKVNLFTCYHPSAWATDPVNVWARNLYLKMFQKYRPASSYSASDLGIAILASLEVIKLIATYERIYGIINRYSVLNVNMPNGEAAALGIGGTTLTYLQGHMSDFRYDLNYLIRKAQRICIPKDVSFTADAISLFGYEYIDHDNPRGQLILFGLQNYGVYDDVALSTGGSIQFENTLEADLFDFSADNMCKALSTTINALLGSDSVQRIFADLFVWFGEEAMLQFLPVPEDYMIAPAVSDSILHKLHNLEGMPVQQSTQQGVLTSFAVNGLSASDETVVLNGFYHIYQYNDRIITTAAAKDTNAGTANNVVFDGISGKILYGTTSIRSMEHAHLVDGYKTDVDPEFMVEGTLLKCDTTYPIASDRKACIISSCVSYVVGYVFLYNALGSYTLQDENIAVNATNAKAFAGSVALVDWAPLGYSVNDSTGVSKIEGVYGDLDVIVPISAVELQRIQRTCFLSGIQTDAPIKS